MNLQLLRHATLIVEIGGKKLLTDPMLGEAESMEPIINSANDRRNPLVTIQLPENIWQTLDGILLTHTHRDHFDAAAAEMLPKDKPMLCQPEDEKKLKDLGFLQVIPIEKVRVWEGITITRTGGEHGTGEIGEQMAPVSGFTLSYEEEPSLYIAGDTIYCAAVEETLDKCRPSVIVLNGGGARFNVGDPITMTPGDIAAVCRKAPEAQLVAVHMEAINHCLVSRQELADYLVQEGLRHRVAIPADGERISFL